MAPPLDLLHVAPTSHLIDEVGRCRGARLNSSTRHDGLDAINYLDKTSMEGRCLEVATSAGRKAHNSLGTTLAPQMEQPDPLIDGCSSGASPKTNQLPTVRSGATEQWVQ
jgi:hypothetical protein